MIIKILLLLFCVAVGAKGWHWMEKGFVSLHEDREMWGRFNLAAFVIVVVGLSMYQIALEFAIRFVKEINEVIL